MPLGTDVRQAFHTQVVEVAANGRLAHIKRL
jgi:hypothetical protein